MRVIHEHDFLFVEMSNHFVQCRSCNIVYCIICGKRIASVVTRQDHGIGKCIRSDTHSPKVSFQ